MKTRRRLEFISYQRVNSCTKQNLEKGTNGRCNLVPVCSSRIVSPKLVSQIKGEFYSLLSVSTKDVDSDRSLKMAHSKYLDWAAFYNGCKNSIRLDARNQLQSLIGGVEMLGALRVKFSPADLKNSNLTEEYNILLEAIKYGQQGIIWLIMSGAMCASLQKFIGK